MRPRTLASSGLVALLAASAHAAPVPAPSLRVMLDARSGDLATRLTGETPTLQLAGLRWTLTSEAGIPSLSGRDVRLSTGVKVLRAWPAGMAWVRLALERDPHAATPSPAPMLETALAALKGSIGFAAHTQSRTMFVPQAPVLIVPTPEPPESLAWSSYYAPRPDRQVSITSLELETSWSHRRVEVMAGTGVGLGLGIAPVWLTRARGMYWMRPGLAATLEASGSVPGWWRRTITDPSRLQVGVQADPRLLAAWRGAGNGGPPPTWSVVRLGEGLYALRARLHGVGTVAVRGDFTGWEPVRAVRAGIGWWEATLRVGPGAHQIEVSLNGGPWQAPQGLPTTIGEYGTEVGTFVAD
jgi:hypothetical protein